MHIDLFNFSQKVHLDRGTRECGTYEITTDLEAKAALSSNCAAFTSWLRACPGKSEEIEPGAQP